MGESNLVGSFERLVERRTKVRRSIRDINLLDLEV
jgi:hypothetical protein